MGWVTVLGHQEVLERGQPWVEMSEPHPVLCPLSCCANIKISYLVSSLAASQRTATVNVCTLNYMISMG